MADPIPSKAEAAALRLIASSEDAGQLRRLRVNALAKGSDLVAEAAFARLLEILPDEAPGSFEHDFWKSIHVLEELLGEERGRTTRLSRTRQKLARADVHQTLADLALTASPSSGFAMLIERDKPELTAEAVILRHRMRFDDNVVEAAESRLAGAGVDMSRFSSSD